MDNFDLFLFFSKGKPWFHECKKLNVPPEVFCCFLTVFDQCKKYALFRNNRMQLNVRKRNHSFPTAIASVFYEEKITISNYFVH